VIFLTFFINGNSQTTTDTSFLKNLSKKLDEFINSSSGDFKFNGSVLISKKGEIILQKGYGFQNIEAQLLNNSNTVFQIGSMTKQFTAAVILKLEEAGKLSVQDKLSKYFPGYRYGNKISLENLLTHTSGIYNYTNSIDARDSAIVCNPVDKKLILDAFYDKPLEFKPGTKFSYDNSDYYLLGLIIEKITSKPYEQVVREMIFDPAGMTHSGFNFRNINDSYKAVGYINTDENKPAIAQRWDSTVTYAAGGIYSTTGDLYKWAEAIKNKQILSEKSWKQMFTPHLGNYGYGWWVKNYFDKKYFMHSGVLPGFVSYFTYYPDDDVNIILLQNSSTGSSGDGTKLLILCQGLSAILFNKPYTINKDAVEITLPDSILEQYVGTYALDKRHLSIVTLEKDRLQIVTPNGGIPKKSTLFAESENHFFLKEINIKLEFIKDKHGNVTQLVYHVNGVDEIDKKIN
jgi:CubicO group peptidase (beta-lactamase class C family)